MRRNPIAFSLLLLATTGCQASEGSSPKPDAGSSGPSASIDLTNVSYATGVTSASFDGATDPITLCDFLSSEDDFVAIIEVLDVGPLESSEDCTESEYVSWHKDLDVLELGRARGQLAEAGNGPARIVRIGSFFERTVQRGDVLLVKMRKSEGEWILLEELLAGNPGDYDPVEGEREVDIPADFDVLTMQANAIVGDYPNECPNMGAPPANDEQFADLIRTPGCSPGGAEEEDLLPDATFVPRANSETGGDAGPGDAGR